MASLTDTLPTSNYTKPSVATEVKQPDYFGAAADFGKGALGALDDVAQRKAAAERDARAAASADREVIKFKQDQEKRTALNELAIGEVNILSPVEIERAQAIVRGEASGNMDSARYSIATNQLLTELTNKYKGQAYEVLTALKATGMDGVAFRELAATQSMETAKNEAAAETYKTRMEAFVKTGMPDANLSEDDKLTIGRLHIEKTTENEIIAAELEAETKRTALNKTKTEAEIAASERKYVDNLVTMNSTIMMPFVNELSQIFAAAGNDIEANTLAIDAAGNFQILAEQAGANMTAQLAFITDEKQRARAKESIAFIKGFAADVATGDLSQTKQKVAVLSLIQNNTKLQGYQAAPELLRFVDTFGQGPTTDLLKLGLTNIVYDDKNPQIAETIVTGVYDVLNGNYGSKEAQAAIKYADEYDKNSKDPRNINQMDPEQAKQAMKMRSSSIQNTRQDFLDNPENVQAADKFMSDFMSLSFAAAQVAPNTAKENYSSSVEKAFLHPKTLAAIDKLEAVSPAMAQRARINLATVMATSIQADKTKKHPDAVLVSGGAPSKGKAQLSDPYAGLYVPSTEISFNTATQQYEAKVGKVAKGYEGNTYAVSRETEADVARMNKTLDMWLKTEEKLGSMPEQFETEEEKRQFLATSTAPEAVTARFNKSVEESAGFTNSRDAVAASTADFKLRVNQAIQTMATKGLSRTPRSETIPTTLQGFDTSSFNKRIQQIIPDIEEVAQKNGVPAPLIAAMMQQESAGDPFAVSSAGAVGLMQLMPGTAKEMGVEDSTDPQQNLEGGTKYIASMINKYDGNITYALMAYNWGPGNVDKWLASDGVRNVPDETQDYVARIMKRLGHDVE